MLKITKENIQDLQNQGWKVGYKVVRVHNKQLFSAVAGDALQTKQCNILQISHCPPLRYKVHQKTYPRAGCGPLCIFKDADQAFLLAKKWSAVTKYVVYKCRYKPSKRVEVWNCTKADKIPTRTDIWHLLQGTVLAESVILVERISSTSGQSKRKT